MYRVIPPTGLALPDVQESPQEAYQFFLLHYFDPGVVEWFWLEKIRPLRFSDFIVPSMLSGMMKEEMAVKGIDDSHMPDQLASTIEEIARIAIDDYTTAAGIDVPGWIVEDRARVDK